MAEYIEREVAFDAITDIAGKSSTRSAYEAVWKSARVLKKIPVADVAPVVHGRWDIMDGTKTRRICSKCRWDVPEYGKFYSYCPNCGARMDGVE